MKQFFIPVTLVDNDKTKYWINFNHVLIMIRDEENKGTFLFFDYGRTKWYKCVETPEELNILLRV